MLDVLKMVCHFARLEPMIEDNQSVSFFWILYFFAVFVIVAIIGLIIYTIYSLSINKFYFLWPVNLLKTSLTFMYWVLFIPFMEVFMAIFRCENGHHLIDSSLQCYQGMHIFFVVFSLIFVLLLLIICSITALFYNETQPIQEEAFAR